MELDCLQNKADVATVAVVLEAHVAVVVVLEMAVRLSVVGNSFVCPGIWNNSDVVSCWAMVNCCEVVVFDTVVIVVVVAAAVVIVVVVVEQWLVIIWEVACI